MMNAKKRAIVILLAAALALPLLLTACGSGGGTPTGNNSTPGGGDNTPDVSDPTSSANGASGNSTPNSQTESQETKTGEQKYYVSDIEFDLKTLTDDLGVEYLSEFVVNPSVNGSTEYTSFIALFLFKYSDGTNLWIRCGMGSPYAWNHTWVLFSEFNVASISNTTDTYAFSALLSQKYDAKGSIASAEGTVKIASDDKGNSAYMSKEAVTELYMLLNRVKDFKTADKSVNPFEGMLTFYDDKK